jgi:hypothetical protein
VALKKLAESAPIPKPEPKNTAAVTGVLETTPANPRSSPRTGRAR